MPSSQRKLADVTRREQLAQPRQIGDLKPRLALSKAMSSVCIAKSKEIAIFHKCIIKTNIYICII